MSRYFGFRIFLTAILAVALLAAPAWACAAETALAQQAQAQDRTVAGKVTAKAADSLTLEIQERGQPRAIKFEMTKDTVVEGDIAEGAKASVTYRAEGEKLIALRVVVQSAAEN